MTYYARSATPYAPNQPYNEHIGNVTDNACWSLTKALRYWRGNAIAESLTDILGTAALFHDSASLTMITKRFFAEAILEPLFLYRIRTRGLRICWRRIISYLLCSFMRTTSAFQTWVRFRCKTHP